MIRLTWDDVTIAAQQQARLLDSRCRPSDGIVILGRGGLAVASLLSRFKPKLFDRAILFPIRDGVVRTIDPLLHRLTWSRVVYLIDDIYDTGRTFTAVDLAIQTVVSTEPQVWYAPLVSKQLVSGLLAGRIIETTEWIQFPWEVENDVAPLHR